MKHNFAISGVEQLWDLAAAADSSVRNRIELPPAGSAGTFRPYLDLANSRKFM